MNQPAIALRDVDVGYRSRPLFTALTLEIPRASFQAVLGTNGSGKTTLLKTIAGILPPLRGRVQFEAGSSAIGYVPQKESLDPLYLFSALEVTLMGACRKYGPGRRLGAEARAAAVSALELTGAVDFKDRLFSHLSGGQKQRALIARALLTEPDILILDEPTAGVDAAASENILQLLQKLQATRGMTLLLVTHDLPLVRRHIRDAIWVREGAIEQGPVAGLLAPKRVGELLGIQLE